MDRIIRSNRKTLSLELNRQGELIIRAPKRMPESQIRAFVASKAQWIETRRQKLLAAAPDPSQRLTEADIRALAQAAKADLPPRAARFAAILGVSYGRITIRSQSSRWGSCSSKGNLNFNCLLMLTPEAQRDYVVVHELCHRLHMDHSPAFWAQVERILPDYRQRVRWFRDNETAILRRMTG